MGHLRREPIVPLVQRQVIRKLDGVAKVRMNTREKMLIVETETMHYADDYGDEWIGGPYRIIFRNIGSHSPYLNPRDLPPGVRAGVGGGYYSIHDVPWDEYLTHHAIGLPPGHRRNPYMQPGGALCFGNITMRILNAMLRGEYDIAVAYMVTFLQVNGSTDYHYTEQGTRGRSANRHDDVPIWVHR